MLLNNEAEAARMSHDDALDIAYRLEADEYDSWRYDVRRIGYWEWGVAVHDEDENFLGYL